MFPLSKRNIFKKWTQHIFIDTLSRQINSKKYFSLKKVRKRREKNFTYIPQRLQQRI